MEDQKELLKYVKSQRKPVFNKKGEKCGFTSRQIRRLIKKTNKNKKV